MYFEGRAVHATLVHLHLELEGVFFLLAIDVDGDPRDVDVLELVGGDNGVVVEEGAGGNPAREDVVCEFHEGLLLDAVAQEVH